MDENIPKLLGTKSALIFERSSGGKKERTEGRCLAAKEREARKSSLKPRTRDTISGIRLGEVKR